MTVRLTRFHADSRGIAKLLALPGVQDDLDERAIRAASEVFNAGIRVEGTKGGGKIELPVQTVSAPDTKRARALVMIDHPSGLAVEAKHGVLASSIDAAGNVE